MLLKREILVEGNAQVVDSWRKMNRGSIQIDRERERQAFLVVFRSNENHLCLIRIQLQFIVVHPCLNIRYARLWAELKGLNAKGLCCVCMLPYLAFSSSSGCHDSLKGLNAKGLCCVCMLPYLAFSSSSGCHDSLKGLNAKGLCCACMLPYLAGWHFQPFQGTTTGWRDKMLNSYVRA